MLARFSSGGSVDAEAFFAVVGTVVRQAVATGRPVRAYGEMVALLWNDGYVAAAIELETLWNELGRQVPFSLYCTYPRVQVSPEGRSQALQDVCHLHSSVVDSKDPRQTAGQASGDELARRACGAGDVNGHRLLGFV